MAVLDFWLSLLSRLGLAHRDGHCYWFLLESTITMAVALGVSKQCLELESQRVKIVNARQLQRLRSYAQKSPNRSFQIMPVVRLQAKPMHLLAQLIE